MNSAPRLPSDKALRVKATLSNVQNSERIGSAYESPKAKLFLDNCEATKYGAAGERLN